MAHYIIDILRDGPFNALDKRRISALNDAEAVVEADAMFLGLFAHDPTVTGYRLREPRRRSSRIVRETQKEAVL